MSKKPKAVSDRFRRELPQATHELLGAVGMLAREMGYRAYLVGGIVRDLVLSYPNTDLDVVIDGDAERFARSFARKTGSVLKHPTGFKTCKLESNAFGTLDLAAARRETYRRPGALPEVSRSGMDQDLLRRDFTVNAMAVSLDPATYGELLDPLGGLDDLVRRKLRVMHPKSFQDDPTRILRGIRFAARYGFGFEPQTLSLLKDCLRQRCLKTISGKRVFTELRLICREARPERGLRLLRRYGVLESLDSRLGCNKAKAQHVKGLKAALEVFHKASEDRFAEEWLCWFSALFVGVEARTSQRLVSYFGVPKGAREVCAWVSRDMGRTASRLSRLKHPLAYKATMILRLIPPEAMVHLYIASSPKVRRVIREYLARWRQVSPQLTGGQIAAMGAGESPLVGRLLQQLLKLKLEGKTLTREDEIDYVMARIQSARRPPLQTPGSELKT